MKPIVICDVTARVSVWTQRGSAVGYILGIILGAIPAAFPPADSVLTFGTFGTVAVCAAEYASLGAIVGFLTAALSRPAITRRACNQISMLPGRYALNPYQTSLPRTVLNVRMTQIG